MHWKEKIHEIIYEADTKKGRIFDIILLIAISFSIVLVLLDSVQSIYDKYHDYFYYAEWVITIIFTIEYILRVVCIRKPKKYIFSFYGIIDLLSTLPLYISFMFTASYALMTLRALRLLRVFRILKVTRYIGASNRLRVALRSSVPKIMIFIFSIIIISFIAGTIMYLVEGPEHGFTSIPVSIYWTIVTLTTVGFGDIHPVTPLGQSIATIIMVLGYGIIAVPTGIVSSELVNAKPDQTQTQSCYNCGEKNHLDKAKFCQHCGYTLNQ
ncbi:MAG: ion transporter [Psychroflexus sp.]|nr:ion transporter [Psychroflexus sp.]MDN6310517.1 ion transporter [Psychroflexus sp.]